MQVLDRVRNVFAFAVYAAHAMQLEAAFLRAVVRH
jgi:hypothetical protein